VPVNRPPYPNASVTKHYSVTQLTSVCLPRAACCLCALLQLELKLLGRTRVLVMNDTDWTAQKHPTHNVVTYVEIGRAAYGEWGARLVNFGVVGMSLGVCAAYLVFVGTTLHSVLVNLDVYSFAIGTGCVDPLTQTPGCIALPLLATVPIFMGIALLEDYSRLSWTSLAGICLVVVAMASVLWYAAGLKQDFRYLRRTITLVWCSKRAGRWPARYALKSTPNTVQKRQAES
jgi:hypothetical protein